MANEEQQIASGELNGARQFTSSTEFGKLAEALAKAQGEIEGAKKDSDNPFFHSRYADLASVWEACRKPLSKNGLAVIQLPGREGEALYVDTLLTHSSGQWIASRLFITPVQQTPQAIGSAITYARRYGLQAIVGIAPEDDDGNAAEGRQHGREAAAKGNKKAPVETKSPVAGKRPKHDELASNLKGDNVKPEDFMSAARGKGVIPSNKMTFEQLPEALAGTLLGQYKEIAGDLIDAIPV